MSKTIVFVVFICLLVAPMQTRANKSSYVVQQERADQLYAQGKYSDAFRNYLALAKKGDSFSQYRVSYMHLEGQGSKTDLAEAFAWANLAAQNKQDEFIEYRDTVARLVPQDEQKKAMRKLDYYMRKWGNRQLADNAIRDTKRELHECTGSRLGTRCEEVYAAQMPKFWGINPGNGSEAETVGGGSSQSGSRTTDIGNQPGSSQRDVAYYQSLRQRINELNNYIGDHSGTVELGEFRVLEDEKKADSNDESP